MNPHVHALPEATLPRSFRLLRILVGAGVVMMLWRFLAGLGATTALNDGYPWGLWIAFDVVTGTALACGGYAIAILVYVLNKGAYHPLVRPALVTSALGYTLAGLAIVLDVGRYWNLYKVLYVWRWNPNSVLLEVALCIMAYVVVLWIELSPAFLERWRQSASRALRWISQKGDPILQRALIWIIALGILLPTMHQSSLGSLLLIATHKLHPLWHTPLLPLLFLISCIAMGYAVVVFESALSSHLFHRRVEKRMLASLSSVMVGVLLVYLIARFADVVVRGQLAAAFRFDGYSLLFLVEVALFLAPALMLLSRRARSRSGSLFRAAMLMMLAGAWYRFDVYLIAFNPGRGWIYFPSVPELVISMSIVALEILGYVAIVRRFPILGGLTAATVER